MCKTGGLIFYLWSPVDRGFRPSAALAFGSWEKEEEIEGILGMCSLATEAKGGSRNPQSTPAARA
jgi:hypothetical protein